MRTHKQRQKALVFHNTIVGELGFRTGVQFSSCVVNKPLDSADYIDKRRESWLTAVDFVRPVSTCIVSITDVRRVNTAISVGASHHVRPVARYTHGTYTHRTDVVAYDAATVFTQTFNGDDLRSAHTDALLRLFETQYRKLSLLVTLLLCLSPG